MKLPDIPALRERARARMPWFDHLMRAWYRFQEQRGNYYAAGITYFSILSLVPVLMVVFAIASFVITKRPELLDQIKTSVSDNVPGSLGDTLNSTIDSAISARSAVGVFGLLGAAYGGLGWMANIRDALTAMWDSQRGAPPWWKAKIYDLGSLLGLGLAFLVSFGLSALSSSYGWSAVVGWLNLDHLPGIGLLGSVVGLVISVAASWAVFAWVIARLPREPVGLRSAFRGALIAAIAFEILKQIGVVYLARVSAGPAGIAFGPIIGLLVFVNLTARMVLLATAWSATTRESLDSMEIEAPQPAIIRPRMVVREGGVRSGLIGAIGGLLTGVVLGRRRRRR